MKIFYHCFGSTHSSVIAASIHLGFLPQKRIPSIDEVISLPAFDKRRREEIGNAHFMGRDEMGNDIYVIGFGSCKDIAIRSIYSIIDIFGISRSEILLIDTLRKVNLLTRIGGFLSRRLGLVWPGRYLAAQGVRMNYLEYVKFVNGVKKSLGMRL